MVRSSTISPSSSIAYSCRPAYTGRSAGRQAWIPLRQAATGASTLEPFRRHPVVDEGHGEDAIVDHQRRGVAGILATRHGCVVRRRPVGAATEVSQS